MGQRFTIDHKPAEMTKAKTTYRLSRRDVMNAIVDWLRAQGEDAPEGAMFLWVSRDEYGREDELISLHIEHKA